MLSQIRGKSAFLSDKLLLFRVLSLSFEMKRLLYEVKFSPPSYANAMRLMYYLVLIFVWNFPGISKGIFNFVQMYCFLLCIDLQDTVSAHIVSKYFDELITAA